MSTPLWLPLLTMPNGYAVHATTPHRLLHSSSLSFFPPHSPRRALPLGTPFMRRAFELLRFRGDVVVEPDSAGDAEELFAAGPAERW